MAVTQAMAKAFWPGRSALGKCVLFQEEGEPEPPCTTVVGVFEDHRRQELVEERPHFLHFLNLPHPMVAEEASSGIVVRTAGPASDALPALGTEARAASGALRHPRLLSLQEQLEPQLRSWRLGATMFTVFGLLALAVAALGLSSVLAYDVALRRHQLGVRAALGADTSRLVVMVFGRALRVVAAGTAAGLAVAVPRRALEAEKGEGIGPGSVVWAHRGILSPRGWHHPPPGWPRPPFVPVVGSSFLRGAGAPRLFAGRWRVVHVHCTYEACHSQ
jgi:hypothetical protein